jgi:hypothetical protein
LAAFPVPQKGAAIVLVHRLLKRVHGTWVEVGPQVVRPRLRVLWAQLLRERLLLPIASTAAWASAAGQGRERGATAQGAGRRTSSTRCR